MSIYDFKIKNIKNEDVSLENYKGKTLLIVNVASDCGFTPQYEELQELYNNYKDKGLEVLGFPCNQFGKQEPGSNEEILSFCTTKFSVSFPMFAKIDVNGDHADPFFNYLKEALPGLANTKKVKWNFTKFLIDKEGKPIKRFSPQTKPSKMTNEIEALL